MNSTAQVTVALGRGRTEQVAMRRDGQVTAARARFRHLYTFVVLRRSKLTFARTLTQALLMWNVPQTSAVHYLTLKIKRRA